MIEKKRDERTWKNKLADYWVNDGTKLIAVLLFIMANIAVFLERFLCNHEFFNKLKLLEH